MMPHGFVNLGANCWFNSLLQSLLCCESFVNAIVSNRDEFMLNPLGKVLLEMFDQPLSKRPFYTQRLLSEFQRLAKAQRKTIEVYSQEGCQNGFTVFMELFNSNIINDLFINKSYNIVICPCCKESKQNQSHEFSIQVTSQYKQPLVKGGGERSFNEWLKSRVSIVDVYKCSKCNTISKDVVMFDTLATLRDIIVVFVVDNSRQQYPDTLSFDGKDGNPRNYKMVAAIQHIGGIDRVTYRSSGHYLCYGARGTQCYIFNDSSVTPVSSIMSSVANVIMYQLV